MRHYRFAQVTRLTGIAVLIVLLISGCGRAPGSMGSSAATAEEALVAALRPGGWLGPLDDVTLHTMVDAPESRVALYSAKLDGTEGWAVGVADAKQRWRGWYAHGRIGDLTPAPPAGRISCVQMVVPAGGKEWHVIAGRLVPEQVAGVELVMLDGTVIPALIRENLFTGMVAMPAELSRVRALDAGGVLVEELSVTGCPA